MSAPLSVLHLVNTYLPYSRTWLHSQILGVPGVAPHVLAHRSADDGPRRFPVPALRVLARAHPLTWGIAAMFGVHGLRRAASLHAWSLRRDASGALALCRGGSGEVFPRPALPNGIDLAHAHFGHVAWAYLPLIRRASLPLVTSFYGHDMSELPASNPRWRTRYRELFAGTALVLCEGPAMCRALVDLGCPPDKVTIQRLGIDPARFPCVERRRSASEPLRVLTVCRFKEKKGVPDAIAAILCAAEDADIRLTLVGDAAHDAEGRREMRRIERALARGGAARVVTLTGRLPHGELAALAATHHVVLQPSRRSSTGDTEGGLPVGLIELAATGLAPVATRHADIPELVVEDETGLLADEGDVDGLARHLVRLARDPELTAGLGRAAARRVRTIFTHESCGESLRRHYLHVCGPARAPAHLQTDREIRRSGGI